MLNQSMRTVLVVMVGIVSCVLSAEVAAQPDEPSDPRAEGMPQRPTQPAASSAGAPSDPRAVGMPQRDPRATGMPPLPPLPTGNPDRAPSENLPDNPVFFENAYLIGEFTFAYITPHPQQPPIGALLQTEVDLSPTAGGYIAPTAGYPAVRLRLADLNARGDEVFTLHALQFAVFPAIADRLRELGLLGVFVAPDPNESIAPGSFDDMRTPGDTMMRLLVATAEVKRIRSFAFGDRLPAEQREDAPQHARIRRNSPLQPDAGASAQTRRDLLERDPLNEYALMLSRHPGRRVDVAIAGAEEGGAELHYMINENKPLLVYGQASNTGTEETDKWRYRFGFIHSQLTGNDDILTADYITSGFDESHAVLVSYEGRIGDNDRARWRVFGNWSEYTASEVGIQFEPFEGESYGGGIEAILNFYQHEDLFLDLVVGGRYEHQRVINNFVNLTGEGDFFIPYGGVRLERRNEQTSTLGALTFEYWLTEEDQAELNRLGRLFPEEGWPILRADLRHSFYLEPLINPAGFADPEEASTSTLAHEILFGVKGQYTFDERVIPQAQSVIGGLYTVRGYPESSASGDNSIVATAEYRFHVPRIFAPDETPGQLFGQAFRWQPQYVYGRPDWDLIVRTFLDVGYVESADPFSFEEDHTLIGTGLGVELQLKQNVNLRLDWGVALQDYDPDRVSSGSNRFHFIATFLY